MSVLDWIDKAEFKKLSTPSNLQAAWVVFCNVVLIGAAFALPALWPQPWAWVVASIVLGGRAQALGILTHETAHLTFFTSRQLNEWAGTWLFGSLPNVPYQAYRKGHLEHHRSAGTDKDPDLGFVQGYPVSRASMCRKFLRDVSGINGLKNIAYQLKSFDRRGTTPFLLAHSLLFALLYALGVPQVYACWWLGQLFVFPLVVRLRAMGEHGAVQDHFAADPRLHTGTTLPGPLGRLLVGSNFVNFHVEHHLAASVPCYRLAALHRHLWAQNFFQGFQCVAPSYVSVLRQCISNVPRAAQASAKKTHRGIFNNMQ